MGRAKFVVFFRVVVLEVEFQVALLKQGPSRR